MPGYRKPMPVRGYANGGPPMEQLDSIMMTGGPSNVPMGTPGMGGPPPGPPMGGPPPGQDPMASLMGNEAALGGGGIDRGMGGQGGMSIEEDAGALAEAVIGRAEGDIGAAVAILDTAKEMLMASGQEPMMANMGRPLMRRSNGGNIINPQSGPRMQPTPVGLNPEGTPYTSPLPLAAPGVPVGPPPMPQESRVRRGPGFADGGSISDRDTAMEAAIAHSQTGRTISDKDLERHSQMHSGRSLSDKDRSGRTMSERDTQNMSPDEKDEYFSEIIRMRRGG